MKILSNSELTGDIVRLQATRQKHIEVNQNKTLESDSVTKNFSDLFNNALEEVNSLELKSSELTNQMVVDPGSVNIHDVQIAAEQAEMAVLLTKNIMDKVIRAYKEIINLR